MADEEKQEPSTQGTSAPKPMPVEASVIEEGSRQVEYQKGCVGAAWDDIKGSKGWFGKVALMGIIEMVPILNFVNAGYAMRWSRDLFFGRIGDMPSKIFADRAFVNGFMCFVLQLIVGVATWFVSLALHFVPVIGIIISFLLMIFVAAFLNLMVARTAIFDEIGAGLGFSQILYVAKGHYGTLFAIWLLPSLITGVIALAICLFVIIVNSMFVGNDITNFFTALALQYGDSSSLENALTSNAALARTTAFMLLNYFSILAPGLIVCFYIVCFLGVLSQLLELRAAGHFCARWANDWKDDPRYDYVLKNETI